MNGERCTARKTNGDPCRGWRVDGSDKCNRHLFNPTARAKAAVRGEVMRWGLGDTTTDPGETLLRLVSQAATRAQRYADELEQLVADSPNLRAALVAQSYGEFGPTGEYVRGLAQLEAAERDRCAGFCAKAIAAGLAERQVHLAEKQGALIAEVLRAVLNDPELGLTEQQRRAMPHVARRHLSLAS
ncbi:MAG TPA: hypothetical protein VGJ13_05185 [Pseudonocardiaceae bacterium]